MSLTDKIAQLVIRAKDEVSKPATDAAAALEQLDDKGRELAKQLRTLEDQQRLIQSFQAQEKATRRAAEANEKARTEVSRLAAAYDAAETPSKELTLELQRAQRAANQSATAYARQEARLNEMGDALDAAALDSKDLAAAQSRIGTEIDATSKALQDNAKQSQKASAGLKEMGDSAAGIGSKIKGLAIGLASFLGITAGLDAVKRGLQSILSTGDQFERLDKQLTAVMGSIEGGEQAAAWIKEFAKDTPLELEQVTQVFTKLKAFGIDPMNGSMQAVVDQAYKLGGSFETVEGISLALGQAWAKQKLQGEEILQLVERGVPVWDMLAKATGKNTLELQALSSAGKLGRTEIQLLMDEIAASSQGAAQGQMSTLSGLISNLKDSWTGFLNDIASSGVLDYFKGQLQALSAEISRMAASGELRAMAQRISDGIVTAAQAVKGFITNLWEARTVILSLSAAAGAVKLWQMFAGVVAASRTAITAITAVTGAINTATKGAGTFASVLRGAIVVAATASAAALVRLGSAWREMRAAQRDADEAARSAAQQQAAVREQLSALSDQLGISITDMDQFNRLVDDGTIVWDEAAGTWTTAAAQLAAMAPAMDSAAAAAAALTERTAALAGEFTRAMSEGKGAEEAIKAVFAAAATTTDDGLLALQRALQQLAGQGDAVAASLRDGIRQQLADMSANELAQFGAAARENFGGAQQWADSAGLANAALAESFSRLGLDINEVRGEMTDAGTDALALFNGIAANAQTSGAAIQAAFDAALGKLKTNADVEALRAQVLALGEQGRLTGDQLAQMLAELERRSTDVIPGIQSVEEAFKALGITSERELKRAADAAKEAFEVIKAEGTLAEQKAAFEAYAKTAIAANQGVADSTLQAQAAALGMGDELGKLGGAGAAATVQLAGLPDVIGAIKASSEETQAALQDVRAAVDEVAKNTDQGVRAVASSMAMAAEGARSEVEKLGTASLMLFQRLMTGTTVLTDFATESDAVRAKLAEVGEQLRLLNDDAMTVVGGNQLGDYYATLKDAMLRVQQAYYSQRLEVEQLIDTYNDAGGATAQWLRQAEGLVPQLELLNDTDLSAIRANIDSARRAMEQLRDSGEDAVASLRSELAELQGDYEAVEQLRAAQRKAELQAKLDEARTFGDREAIARYQEALDLLERVNAIKASEARERTETSRTRNNSASNTAPTTSQPTTTSSNSGSGRFVLELKTPGGSVDVATDADSFAALTRTLNNARKVS